MNVSTIFRYERKINIPSQDDSNKPSLQRLMNPSGVSQLKLKWSCDEHIHSTAYPTLKKNYAFYGRLLSTAPQRHVARLCFLAQGCNVLMFLYKIIMKANHSLHVWRKVVNAASTKHRPTPVLVHHPAS